MKNLFRKLLEREFGELQYYRMARRMLQEPENNFLNMTLTRELAERLRRKRQPELWNMRKRLEETLLCSYRISRGYWPYAAFCFFAVLVLFLLVTPISAGFLSLAGIVLCYGIRTREYITNKYCYIDAKLILCYRIALEESIREGKGESGD